MLRLNLPGETAAWRADRTLPIGGPTWRLAQTTTLGSAALTFGLTGQRGEAPRLTAMSDFGGGPQPYAARLLIRDQDRAPQPYLSVWRQGASAPVPLRARTAPRPMNDIYPAGARGPPPTGACWRLARSRRRSLDSRRRRSTPSASWIRARRSPWSSYIRDRQAIWSGRPMSRSATSPPDRRSSPSPSADRRRPPSALGVEGDDLGARARRVFTDRGRREHRQPHRDRRALAQPALDRHGPAVQLREGPDQ